MASGRVRLSVVICAYTEKRWDDLVAAVESLRVQTHSPEEVILVIDHNPGLATRVWREMPDVTCVENHGRQGLSDARNSGLAVATGDVVAFLDDDAEAEPQWLSLLAESYDDPAVVGVGGFAEPDWAEGRPSWFPREFDWVVGCTYRGMPETAAPVRNLIGCNMSFRREIFADLGGFTAGIGRLGTRPVGCEETELCIRIAQRRPGSVILFDPRALVHHHVPGSRGTWAYFRSRCYAEGLSKAAVAALVGASQGLASERTYATRTLPRGVVNGIAAGVKGEAGGFGRAAAIVAGVGLATVGYGLGRLRPRRFVQAGMVPAA
ncbi:MAG TPA: glycosyltransferase family 2 protein [Actinomycetota bacterium]|nr:glycosyltransferase family 2 protein [Actinomycetota bacterium]